MFDKVINNIAAAANQAAQGNKEHLEADGLLHCDVCGEKTQTRVQVLGQERKVRCICRCVKEKQEREEKARREEQRLRRIKALRVQGFDKSEMQGWRFENDDGKNPKATTAARSYCERFKEFKEQGKGLLFHGSVGTGKTYTAACIANALIDKGVPVLMTNFSRIINTVQGRFEGRQEYIDSLNNFDLLIIDDLAAERNTEFVNEIVFSVIDARYRSGLPLIVTTNVAARAMAQEREQDRQRIYSRVLEMCHPIEVGGADRRAQAAARDYAEINKMLGI